MCQASRDHTLGDLGDVGGQGDGAVTWGLLEVLARLGDGDDDDLAPLPRDAPASPRGVNAVWKRLAAKGTDMLEMLVAQVIWAWGLL